MYVSVFAITDVYIAEEYGQFHNMRYNLICSSVTTAERTAFMSLRRGDSLSPVLDLRKINILVS